MRNPGWKAAAAAMFVAGWGGNQFTPLLVMYRDNGLSVVTVDALLGAYVGGLVPGLLTAGALSEKYGRKPLMITSTVLSLVGSVLLALDGVGWIAAGRFVSGIAVSIAMAVGSTWVVELSVCAGASKAAGTRRGALWLTLGLGLGAGVAGALAQWAPAPTVSPYLVHIALAVLCLPALLRVPETRVRETRVPEARALQAGALEAGPLGAGALGAGALKARRGPGRFAAARHPRFRRVITPMAPWIFGSAGVAYAIMPQLVGDRLGDWGLAYSALLTVCTLGAGALVQPLARRLDRATSARAVVVGMAVMSVGLVISAVASVVRSPVVALAAAVVLGAAYGIALVAGLLELQRLAGPGELAAFTGLYYALAYVGFLLPSILALLSRVATYPELLALLALVAMGGMAVIARHSRSHLPVELPRLG